MYIEGVYKVDGGYIAGTYKGYWGVYRVCMECMSCLECICSVYGVECLCLSVGSIWKYNNYLYPFVYLNFNYYLF